MTNHGLKYFQSLRNMDTVSKAKRSQIMAQVKGTCNKSTELVFAKYLRKSRISGWRRNYRLEGNPDFVFPKCRVAVFIDGCFWHSCPKHCRLPSSNREYWIPKIARNASRDRYITRKLRRSGWHVFRFWEHDMKGGSAFIRKFNLLQKTVQQSILCMSE